MALDIQMQCSLHCVLSLSNRRTVQYNHGDENVNEASGM